MRLFIAINLSDAVRAAVDAAVAPIRAQVPGIRWVARDLLHITVKFLGEHPDTAAEQIGRVLDDVAEQAAQERCSFESAGAFPNFRRPRVVWMGVKPPALGQLASSIDRALASFGVPAESRPYTPHLTLGRLARDLSREEGGRLRAWASGIGAVAEQEVSSVDLMRSELGRGGPTYTVLRRSRLGLRAAGAVFPQTR